MTTAVSATSPGDRSSVAGDGVASDRATPAFSLTDAWALNPKVAVRPEPFGALLYHFGTRKLSFLKNRTVVGIVETLHEFSDAQSALAAAGIDDASRPLYIQALQALADSGMIIPAQEAPQ
ncbi:MAG TPA: mycofactocin biosynthesis chaperone MftB [Gordonia sp. (in: high G+C Gram-positive bacteria)]|uniref:mycofactocin biosynthesis chaperone MftB n=1 Tax=unclassified Gordonia (in: high G+C Gram-positive bacteria) TaxID=2657482 RepID=UPI000FC154BA|nr:MULTISPECIES: mycofactocin biosynthesis chaperone MftB [unclassified Gordonia (in: high G+C Gram-positive bacteria)]RUP36097.1 MAG: mycofactocin biosynthesis chaperone MftB [Gordonia sp. (in: high G+C Gram-positive bacteria)]HNP57668.1 mycofactocin biosynthesis chaperone MftB [Gordonia sp. (in: high G+C Gram-positive bacteria)]HRC50687.1 mycofactocin biosynthesis chaperone MftB [Gordonia sp. (in: high G+C Gram-positive bacteria)]